MTTMKTFIKPTQILKLSILALSFGSTLAVAQTQMSASDLVSSIKAGDKISLFNAPTLVEDPNLVSTTPLNEKQRLYFTRQKSSDPTLRDPGMVSAVFWDGNKLDTRQFFKADDVATVFLENDVCFVNVTSERPDFNSTEIMNSLKAQKFTLTVEGQPIFESTKNKMNSDLTIYVKPIAVPNGYIHSITCQIHNDGKNPETSYKIEKLAKVFQSNAKFFSSGTTQQPPSPPASNPPSNPTLKKQVPSGKK
jgi:hypothetical protein